MTSERGIALILAILVTSFLTAIGLGITLIVLLDQFAAGNLRGSVALLHAADGALELAARDLTPAEVWAGALIGTAHGRVADGPPSGARVIPGGGTVNLTAAGHQLNCGRPDPCSDAQMNANTRERPWGANNARWRLFAYGPARDFMPLSRLPASYLAVWIADDGRENDGNPERDADAGAPGHGVVRVRVDAFGQSGSQRTIEAELARLCLVPGEGCQQGIRVQSWREVRQAVP